MDGPCAGVLYGTACSSRPRNTDNLNVHLNITLKYARLLTFSRVKIDLIEKFRCRLRVEMFTIY